MSSLNEQQIENLLRAAPHPKAPAGLKEQLIGLAQSASAQSRTFAANYGFAGWLRRWWPALAPATVSLACAVVLTVQQLEIGDLKAGLETLGNAAAAMGGASPRIQASDSSTPVDSATAGADEIARLKEEAKKLSAEISQLELVRTENQKLRAQLAAPPADVLTPEETDAIQQAKERAMNIACINNLKQVGLALRMWAIDNGDVFPPDMLSMSNELSNPKVLICPANTAHEAAKDWSSFTSANCSYNFLAPSDKTIESEPDRVAVYCPIHHNYLLADGSVQSVNPEKFRLIQRDGKYYLERVTGNVPPNSNP